MDTGSTSELLALLHSLASNARPAGSDAERAARAECTRWLTQRGFTCVERPFTYSAWPGTYGVMAVGIALVSIGLLVAIGAFLSASATPLGGVILLHATLSLSFVLLGATLITALWLTRYGTTALPWLRRESVNLEAVRPAAGTSNSESFIEPPVWLVAHLDSKSQSVSMRARVVSVSGCTIVWMAIIAAWVARVELPFPSLVFAVLGTMSALFAVPMALCRLGHEGTGAFDNASGVATILGAIAYLDRRHSAGVVITSAEELGLAGARAWLAGRGTGLAINCDGVDDSGDIVCMLSGLSDLQFHEAFHRAGVMAGEEISVRPLIPGVLVDAVAFKDAGWGALTVSRGTWRSLARVHTREDNAVRLTGSGIDRTARFVGRLFGEMISVKQKKS